MGGQLVRRKLSDASATVPITAEPVEVLGAALSPYPPAPSHQEAISICEIQLKVIATAGVIPRIIEHLAKRSLVPIEFVSRYKGTKQGEYLNITLSVAAELAKIHHICLCWQSTPDVMTVVLKKIYKVR